MEVKKGSLRHVKWLWILTFRQSDGLTGKSDRLQATGRGTGI